MPKYYAGSNMPGYMPDNVPDLFNTFDEAKRAIIWEIKRDEDDAESEEAAEELAHLAEDVNLASSDFNARAGLSNRVYWVRQV